MGTIQENVHLSDDELKQLVCAYRIFSPDVELSLSARERAKLRNELIKLILVDMW